MAKITIKIGSQITTMHCSDESVDETIREKTEILSMFGIKCYIISVIYSKTQTIVIHPN